MRLWGRLGGSVVECLPLAQSVIPRSQDQVPHWAPCMGPASTSACVSVSVSVCVCVSLSVSLINKQIKSLKKIKVENWYPERKKWQVRDPG